MARECIPGCDPSDCQCSAPPAGGGFRRARGILAGARGDALPEVRIRRLRDASDDLSAIVRSFLTPDGPHERVLRDDIWPICGACGERWPCATVREEGR